MEVRTVFLSCFRQQALGDRMHNELEQVGLALGVGRPPGRTIGKMPGYHAWYFAIYTGRWWGARDRKKGNCSATVKYKGTSSTQVWVVPIHFRMVNTWDFSRLFFSIFVP
jgi:hypothetical protein